MFDYGRAVPLPEAARWPGAGRAAALFVGVPLTAALVLAAAPLSEPPPPPAMSALPEQVARPAPDDKRYDEIERRAMARASSRPAGAPPVVVVTPRSVTVSRAVPVPRGDRRPLAPPSIVVIARGVERVELQSP